MPKLCKHLKNFHSLEWSYKTGRGAASKKKKVAAYVLTPVRFSNSTCRNIDWGVGGGQAYNRLSTTHGHITDCKLDSMVYAGVCVWVNMVLFYLGRTIYARQILGAKPPIHNINWSYTFVYDWRELLILSTLAPLKRF